ncbi:hypothetical protein RND81_11G223300 [Saponaria officinalis]|uniref:C2 domain-containing protein n=1 Tax=Saponaria officinalis TaxID=3572 RepID=A0AAW1HQW6_SAPOF
MAESSVKCEIRIFGAKNIVTKKQGSFFIRCYISVGKNKRIQLNTREITSPLKNCEYILWDETFSLECTQGSSIRDLEHEKIVFELRWRNAKTNFLAQMGGSKLLGSSEILLKSVFEEKAWEVQKWVSMLGRDNGTECWDEKPPALQVGVKVEKAWSSKTVSKEEMRRKRRQERLRNLDECGCGCSNGGFCCTCVDNELFLVAAVLDVC